SGLAECGAPPTRKSKRDREIRGPSVSEAASTAPVRFRITMTGALVNAVLSARALIAESIRVHRTAERHCVNYNFHSYWRWQALSRREIDVEDGTALDAPITELLQRIREGDALAKDEL